MYGRYENLTRAQLYELVWTTPMMRLCERFQLSDRGLAKLCDRHEIPVPERGWWAKQAAGQEVRRTPLPKPSQPYLDRVQLWVREDWRQFLSDEEQKWFQDRVAEEETLTFSPVPATDESRHPLIVQARRKPKEGEPPRLHFSLNVSKELRDRALRTATALVADCETRGYSFALRRSSQAGDAGVVILGQNIGVAIEEPFLKVPHELTKSEAREKAVGRGWSIPDFDSVRSGELSIVLDHPISGERRSFGEKPERLIESSFPELFKSLLKIAIRMKADENYQAERVRRQREEAERRAEAERRRRAEEARIAEERRRRRELLRAAARLRQSTDLLSLIESVHRAATDRGIETATLGTWLEQARGVAADLNPVERLLRDFASGSSSGRLNETTSDD